MSSAAANALPSALLPIDLKLPASAFLFQGTGAAITLYAGMTTLLGPNGAGKTQTLKAMQALISGKLAAFQARAGRKMAVRYLGAGRSSPLERYRGAIEGPDPVGNIAAIGHSYHAPRRHEIQSLIGDYLALSERADLRIKVEARLQALLAKRLRLEWSQNGLVVSFVGKDHRGGYSAASEASGVIQMAGVLAALYDDEVSALLIDEPEISLHPQWQRFLLEEIKSVAGDPIVDPKKKIIVISTHSLAMLSLERLTDIPNFVFFTTSDSLPRQLSPSDGVLKSTALQSLFARIGEVHRQALFARTLVLVEGPSDESIASALAIRLQLSIEASSTQVVPVLGKDEMVETAKLFRLLDKRVVVLADIDALADDPKLLQSFASIDAIQDGATKVGSGNLVTLDRSLRADFASTVLTKWTEIAALASTHRYLATGQATQESQRRAALVVLLTTEPKTLPSDAWRQLRNRFDALLSILAAGGCFFVRAGTIEDCYSSSVASSSAGKPKLAAIEAATFAGRTEDDLRAAYRDMIDAIEYAAPKPNIDETVFLRSLLASAVAALFEQMAVDTSESDLQYMSNTFGADASSVFKFTNASVKGVKALNVEFVSSLFLSTGLPGTVRVDQNLSQEVARLLP